MNILEIVKKEFIGQPVRICAYKKSISSPVLVRKKKQGCTHKQWEENPAKYTSYASRQRHLGFHSIFENTTIVDVICENDEYMDGFGESLIAITDTGHRLFLPLNEPIEIINGHLNIL